MNSEDEHYEINVFVTGNGSAGETGTVIRELYFRFDDLDEAASVVAHIRQGAGVRHDYGSIVTYYPHHSIARVVTSGRIYDRALQVEWERISRLVKKKVKEELGDTAGDDRA